ncbi:MAG: YceI family protein [Bacteroidota bacterium]
MTIRLLFILFSFFIPVKEKNTTVNTPPVNQKAVGGELILFVQNGDKITATEKQDIKDLAAELGVVFKLADTQNGVPEGITLTPTVVYQNHLGRSFFKGRYVNISRMKNFIRTAQRIPQKKTTQKKEDMLVWQSGKATIAIPLKITDLAGNVDSDFNQEDFKTSAKQAFAHHMGQFSIVPEVSLPSSSRLFYAALYPYRSDDGKFFVSAEIYSQFNCIDPIFVQFDKPFEAKAKKWEDAFTTAGETIEKEITRQMAESVIGDACQIVSEKVKSTTWEGLGFDLPAKPEGVETADFDPDLKVAKDWVYAAEDNQGTPFLQFNFLAPVDNYAGEVTDMNGSLSLSENLSLDAAIGNFEVKTASVTMGDEGLDDAIRSKMIQAVQFPTSTFLFSGASGTGKTLTFGESEQISVNGDFTMMGISIPIKVQAQLEPILDAEGNPKLQVEASFKLPLKEKFGVDGPDGPVPASETLDFYLNFLMRPA